jgi:anti-anti-sigma factor
MAVDGSKHLPELSNLPAPWELRTTRGWRVKASGWSGFSGAAPPRYTCGAGMTRENGNLLSVRVERSGERGSVISLAGELDLSTIPRVESRLLDQVRTQPSVVVDLSELSFIDSSGIGMLIQAFHSRNGGVMNTVIAPGSQVERVFTIAGIEAALPVFRSRHDALEALVD